jgi:hypothetical protein
MLFGIGLIVAFGVALAARLVPLLRGGGLYALGNYDDGVHFAAAMGVIHDLLPYRDFVFLHPPGVLLALAPFADVLGEPGPIPDSVLLRYCSCWARAWRLCCSGPAR